MIDYPERCIIYKIKSRDANVMAVENSIESSNSAPAKAALLIMAFNVLASV